MVKSCAAIHCTNRQGCEKSSGHCESLSFHSFPLNDPGRLQQWVVALRRDQWTPNQYSAVCSEHFKASDFIYCPNGKKRRLKPEAVPSFFKYPQPQHHNHTNNHHGGAQKRQLMGAPPSYSSPMQESVSQLFPMIRPDAFGSLPISDLEQYYANKRQKVMKEQKEFLVPAKLATAEEQKTPLKPSRSETTTNVIGGRRHKRKKAKQVDYAISSIQNVIDETRKRNLISVEYADFVKFLIKP